ncbi:MAG TPA: MarR family winged helix-turn-helix transcriptional regulator [Acidimicrobiales bacterium]|nr:MarR family winged helix-turn-helix transcriptional regulator [Acidimicrobiales bacterium]
MLSWGVAQSEVMLFGDVLALARRSWVRALRQSLAAQGYHDYRRSDGLALRFFSLGPHSLGAFADLTGTSRQAARKVVTGLIDRGYATLITDSRDARRRLVVLTKEGDAYADAVVKTLEKLNRHIQAKVAPDELRVAVDVLRFVRDNIGR